MLAWLLLLVTSACCAAGLLVTLAITRPLTLAVLAEGAAFALAYPLGYATIGLVLSLRRPAAAAGRPGQLRRRAAPMGASDRLRRHPAAAASARRAAALAPLAAGVATAMVGPVIVVAANALMPAPPEKALVDNPLALGGVAGRLAGVAAWVGVALLVASLPAALVCVAPRFRAARGSSAGICARSLPEPAPRSPPC